METPEDGVLVAYFSATGNTEGIAQHLQSILDADLYEIVPEVPYTDEDLNYSNDNCRANQEQNDPAARPAITGTLEHPENYNVVFLGYPIWWGQAPKVIYTFLESCDFGDATIVPFCTSGSSGIGSSAEVSPCPLSLTPTGCRDSVLTAAHPKKKQQPGWKNWNCPNNLVPFQHFPAI